MDPEAQAAIEKLQVARLETQNFGTEAGNAYLQWNRVGDLFVNGLASAFDTFCQVRGRGSERGRSGTRCLPQVCFSDFLLQIARMIIQQAIFNALRAAFGGTELRQLDRRVGCGAHRRLDRLQASGLWQQDSSSEPGGLRCGP